MIKVELTDNTKIERFWRSVKWKEIYLHEPQAFLELQKKISNYINHYNHESPHQSLKYKTPSKVHFNLNQNLLIQIGSLYTLKMD